MVDSENLSEINSQLTLELDSFKLKYHQETSLLKKEISSLKAEYEEEIQVLKRRLHEEELRYRGLINSMKEQFSIKEEEQLRKIDKLEEQLKQKNSSSDERAKIENMLGKIMEQLEKEKTKNQQLECLLESEKGKEEMVGGISVYVH